MEGEVDTLTAAQSTIVATAMAKRRIMVSIVLLAEYKDCDKVPQSNFCSTHNK